MTILLLIDVNLFKQFFFGIETIIFSLWIIYKKKRKNMCIILLLYFIAYKEFNGILLIVYSIFKFQK
jgi:hypothetical protein